MLIDVLSSDAMSSRGRGAVFKPYKVYILTKIQIGNTKGRLNILSVYTCKTFLSGTHVHI